MTSSQTPPPATPPDLVERLLAGDRRALARAISLIENRAPEARAMLARLHAHGGHAHIVGFTGSPGAGKSTLVTQLARELRKREQRVGVIAVDPSSPFTGGAILGDRIRMQDLAGDPNVFIRSMASRGSVGGLALATRDAVRALDAAGFDTIIVETVGAGQAEVEIVRAAQSVVVVTVPGMGDDIQAIKAGIMEIGDIFVINKADREGVYATEKELEALLSLTSRADGWDPPIVKTVATENQGIEPLAEAIDRFRQTELSAFGSSERRRAIARWRIVELLRERLLARVLASESSVAMLEQLADEVATRRRDPYSAVEELISSNK
jgi:GTPase